MDTDCLISIHMRKETSLPEAPILLGTEIARSVHVIEVGASSRWRRFTAEQMVRILEEADECAGGVGRASTVRRSALLPSEHVAAARGRPTRSFWLRTSAGERAPPRGWVGAIEV